MLRNARESRGISFATAERETHIPRHHLQALEEERFGAFHAPVYARGFLRSYSQYLGLDSTELLALMPADAPLEEERLVPLARLGRPRGPREAARARHDPAERDATPLTEQPAQTQTVPPAGDWDTAGSGRLRFAIGSRAPDIPRPSTRLDPLGRLGWPEQPGQAPVEPEPEMEPEPEAEPYSIPPAAAPPRAATEGQHPPFTPGRAGHWQRQTDWLDVVPEDVRPLFTPRVLLAIVAALAAILALLASVFLLGGGDGDVQALAAALPAQAGGATIRAPAGRPAPHGTMPDVRGADLKSARATLQASGIEPVVIDESAGGSQGQIATQLPAPGSGLDPQTPVLLVVAGSR